MIDHRCGTCRHYQPTRNPDTGRVLPSQAGKCTYPVEWPELPICFRAQAWGNEPRWPSRNEVWPGKLANGCAFWETKTVQKRNEAADAKSRQWDYDTFEVVRRKAVDALKHEELPL